MVLIVLRVWNTKSHRKTLYSEKDGMVDVSRDCLCSAGAHPPPPPPDDGQSSYQCG